MSAWNVYLVMQLDSISMLLLLLGLAGLATTGITTAIGLAFANENPDAWTSLEYRKEAERKNFIAPRILRTAKRIGIASTALLTINAALPSSRTAAAMIVLPAITSAEVRSAVAPEARELYELAKGALRNLAKPESDKKEH